MERAEALASLVSTARSYWVHRSRTPSVSPPHYAHVSPSTLQSPISRLNIRRIALGGFAAGVVSNIFDFVITQYLMPNEFASILARLNVDESTTNSWIPLFALANFVWGFLLVFTYAAIRPRFGPGPKTAVIGGMMVWLALAIAVLILLAIGLHTPQSYFKSAALYLISAVASSLAGAAIYRE